MDSSLRHDEPRCGSIGIVFLHHRCDPVTLNNLQSFKRHNPYATIVTVGATQPLPGGYSILDFPIYREAWARQMLYAELQANSPDLLVYAWYANRHENCNRWIIV